MTEEEVRQAAIEEFERQQHHASPQTHPTFHYVAGPPGSGKHNVAAAVNAELKGNCIRVDAAETRKLVPTGNGERTPREIHTDAVRLVSALRKLARDRKYNILEEGTLRNTDSANQFVDGLLADGYRIEVVAVATPPEESRLGMYQRHEAALAKREQNPRDVNEDHHEEAAESLDRTLRVIAERLDRLRVVDRGNVPLYDGTRGNISVSESSHALSAGRELSDTQVKRIVDGWADVKTAAEQRGAPKDYLTSIGEHAMRLQMMLSVQRPGRHFRDFQGDSAAQPSAQRSPSRQRVCDVG